MNRKPVNVVSIEHTIEMLKQYLDSKEIEPLISALQALREEPESQPFFERVQLAFDSLGIEQGAVLTYAPYVGILLSDDPFNRESFNNLRDDNADQ